jgi:hypothetical protein
VGHAGGEVVGGLAMTWATWPNHTPEDWVPDRLLVEHDQKSLNLWGCHEPREHVTE